MKLNYKLNTMNSIFIVLLGFFLLISCEYTKIKKDTNLIKNIPKLSKEEMDQLSFQKVFNEVLDPYCLSCHRDGKVPLNNYSQVFAKLSDIHDSVFVKGTMPKKKVLPIRERSILFAWIDSGAPEFGKKPTAPPPPIEPTYSSIRDRIFNVRCGNCHNPQSEECQSIGKNKLVATDTDVEAGEGTQAEEDGYNGESCQIELGIYNELVNGQVERIQKELVLPGDPENSGLIFSIRTKDEEGNKVKPEMPPKKQGYSPLSDEEIEAIRKWIEGGALDN